MFESAALRIGCCALLMGMRWVGAHADVDLSGTWGQKIHEDFEERIVGPAIGDFTGLPINAAARRRAESWDDGYWSAPEHQCEAAPADYAPHGPGSLRVWSEVDLKTQRLVAWHVVYLWHTPHRVIWMDARPHPPEGTRHTWMGFSTGRWVGDTLVVKTTHLKSGWIRRNGVPHSDEAALTEYWMRHGDYLTIVSVLEDPIYLTAPFVRSATFALNLGYEIGGYTCSPKVESDLPRGFVAHHLPGTNGALKEYAVKKGLPPEATDGGEETLYPEYARRLAGLTASALYPASVTVAKPLDHPQHRNAREPRTSSSAEVTVLPVRGAVFALLSATGNTTVQLGEDGVLVVDPQRAELSEAILAAIRKLSSKPIRTIVDTSADPMMSGGNETVAKAGRSIGPDAAFFAVEGGSASIYAHENVLLAMSPSVAGATPRDPAAWPTDTYFSAATELFFNDEAIDIRHEPAAHSDGDSLVYFRRSDVISTGEILSLVGYPHIDLSHGGSINGVIDALNGILEITVPERSEEGGTLVVPGNGRLCDVYELVSYRDMLTVIRDDIRALMKKGLTLQQIQAEHPTAGYDGRFGREGEPWTPERFVETVYRSLSSEAGA